MIINSLYKIIIENKILFLFSIIILYLTIGTGIFSDDFSEFLLAQNSNNSIFSPSKIYLNIPLFHYTHYIFYYILDYNNSLFLDLIKSFYLIISLYMITKFFSLYFSEFNSYLISFLIIFFPTHDSTSYLFLAQNLILSFSLYGFSFYLSYKNFNKTAFIFAIFGSFISYGSTPIAISMFSLFLLHKKYKKAILIILPNIIYIAYYISVTSIYSTTSRLPTTFNIIDLSKQYFLQFATFIDSFFGPSFFLKLYYSILSNNFSSIIIIFSIFIILRYNCLYFIPINKVTLDLKKLLFALIILTLSSMLMFAVTSGGYPQIVFNLGNRVTIYGSVLITLLLFLFNLNQKIINSVLLIFLLSIFGISNHWKEASRSQKKIIASIKTNKDLIKFHSKDILYITGNQYSKMGPFSNLEFLSENHVAISIFKLIGYKSLNIKSLNRRFSWKDGILYDNKYNHLKYKTGESVYIYESEKNKLINLPSEKINTYINSLPVEKRHWIQLIKNDFIINSVKKILPQIQYIFD